MKSPKRYGRILWFTCVLGVCLAGAAYAIRPSGPGINTKANSLSVAVATDQPSIPTSPGASIVTLVVPNAATDYTTLCKDGFFVADPDAGTALVQGTGQDAAVSITNLAAGQYVQMAVAKVVDGGTTAKLYCLSH